MIDEIIEERLQRFDHTSKIDELIQKIMNEKEERAEEDTDDLEDYVEEETTSDKDRKDFEETFDL